MQLHLRVTAFHRGTHLYCRWGPMCKLSVPEMISNSKTVYSEKYTGILVDGTDKLRLVQRNDPRKSLGNCIHRKGGEREGNWKVSAVIFQAKSHLSVQSLHDFSGRTTFGGCRSSMKSSASYPSLWHMYWHSQGSCHAKRDNEGDEPRLKCLSKRCVKEYELPQMHSWS